MSKGISDGKIPLDLDPVSLIRLDGNRVTAQGLDNYGSEAISAPRLYTVWVLA